MSDYHRDLSPNSTDSKSVLRHARAVAHHPSNAMLSNAMRALLLAFALITIGSLQCAFAADVDIGASNAVGDRLDIAADTTPPLYLGGPAGPSDCPPAVTDQI